LLGVERKTGDGGGPGRVGGGGGAVVPQRNKQKNMYGKIGIEIIQRKIQF